MTLSDVNSFEELVIPIMDDREYEGPADETFFVQVHLSPNGQNSERVRIRADVAEVAIAIVDNEPRPGIIPLNVWAYVYLVTSFSPHSWSTVHHMFIRQK